MPESLEDRVKAVFRRHYADTKHDTEAWNRTLDEIAPFSADSSEEDQELRHQAGKILQKEIVQLLYEAGDPHEVAARTAMEDLKRDRVAEIVSKKYRKITQELKDDIRKTATKRNIPAGPKEWAPKKQRSLSEGEIELELERIQENSSGEDLTLYILFDEKGGLQGWKTDYPTYWPGHSGPTAVIAVSETLDYDDIRASINEAFAELDWDAISEELEEGDGA